MSLNPCDFVIYGSADMPEADGVTIGGAIDFTTRILFTDAVTNDSIDVVSSAAGDNTQTVTLNGRNSTGGGIVTDSIPLNGTTVVNVVGTFERLLNASVNTTGGTPTGDIAIMGHTPVVSGTAQGGLNNPSPQITLQSGQGASCSIGQVVRLTGGTGPGQLRYIVAISGDVAQVNRPWGTIPDGTTTYTVNNGFLLESAPNRVLAVKRLFETAAADVLGGATRIYHEKVFAVNNNTGNTLNGAQITLQSLSPSLGAAELDMALCTALNDTHTATNRQTAPGSGVGSFGSGAPPQVQSVPGGTLPAGAAPNAAGAIGIWLKLTMPAGYTAYKGAASIGISGTT